MSLTLRPPEPLQARHDASAFSSGRPALDVWLRRRALADQASGASRTFVALDGDDAVAAFHSLAACLTAAPSLGRVRRDAPEPVPAVLLGRLAVDRAWQGRGLARALLRDAIRRVIAAAEAIAARGLVVQPLDEAAHEFYRHLGFAETAGGLLVITLADARAAMAA